MTDTIDWTRKRPKRRAKVMGHDLAGEMVLYDETNLTAVSLNESAASIWRECDGTMTATEIAAKLALVLGVEGHDLVNDVATTLSELRKLDVLDVE